ncbi:MAG: tetratricopeptide repeat protein [Alphaproteobacteria bacterium]|nr:tetratricopeptide repeat protein [Alphaproteobacteria bacterium]
MASQGRGSGGVNAQYFLGHMYYHAEGVTQDYAQAVGWWRKAAEQGAASGQFGLGILYANGQGVQKDLYNAYIAFSLAAMNGDQMVVERRDLAVKYREDLQSKLNPSDRVAAQKRVSQWKVGSPLPLR